MRNEFWASAFAMTYEQKLEELSVIAGRESANLIAAALDTDRGSEARLTIAQRKYDRAEKEYRAFLDMIKKDNHLPADRMP